MMNKNILIIGALGQDGKLLSKILIKKKYNIIGCIKKKKYKNKIKKVIYKGINLNNKKQVIKIIKKYNPSTVIHFGSENPSYTNKKKKTLFYNENYKSSTIQQLHTNSVAMRCSCRRLCCEFLASVRRGQPCESRP